MELNKLYEGDCLEIMPTLPDKSINMILCDLPYGTTACKWDTIIPFEPLWKQYKQLIKDNGAIVLTASQPFTSALVMSNIQMFKYEWIWDKHIPRGFQVAKYRPMNRHENVLVFGDGKLNYQPIKTKRDKPIKIKNYAKDDNNSSNTVKYNDKNKVHKYNDRNPDTIIEGLWEANTGKLHPTQKPVTLFEYLICTYTNEGDTVMDNCAGSGATGIACLNTDRKYILIEKDPKYCEIIRKRIESHDNLNQNVIIKKSNNKIQSFFGLTK